MGAYLSEPKTTKESSDCDGELVSCGASSMQGWRISQEDAHNCILDFDKNTCLFAVYDGHGGHEVADYCSKYLPDFIKQTENYLKGDYEQALKDAFLGFDATLATPEVIEVLKAIMGGKEEKKCEADPESDPDDEEAIQSLVEEAHMPLDEVMAKYKAGGPLCRVLSSDSDKPPVSPMLRGRRAGTSGSGPSCSSSSGCSSSSSGLAKDAGSKGAGDTVVSSSSSSQVLCNGDSHINGELDDKAEAEAQVESSDAKKEIVKPESEKSEKCEVKKKRTEPEPDSSGVGNGESDSHDVSSSSENGSADSSSPSKKDKKIFSAEFYRNLLREDSDSEEEDETFVAEIESEDDSEDEAGDDSCEKGEDDSSDEDEEDDADFPGMDVKEEPGSDSGCTAVVALLVGNRLLVANAGDSRCVVCREGKAVEMSVDHKPEDEPEKERIEAAGGKVTCDGRVNGGLNLSRALGDHAYKQTKLLPASHQMITALPDLQTLTVDPQKDEFMVLACDGIWNSMTSQEVVDFVRIKLEQKTERLSQICEELFDHCLAPNTQGDGTGCDNMTCVIVKFKPSASSVESVQKRPAEEETSLKRPAEDTAEPSAKKSKVEAEDS